MNPHISVNDFRDKSVDQIAIRYDWTSGTHVALISMRDSSNRVATFRIESLVSYELFEDFSRKEVAFCKLDISEDQVRLSLDPYREDLPFEERDLFSFVGKTIVRVRADA